MLMLRGHATGRGGGNDAGRGVLPIPWPAVIMITAGHVSRAMLSRYSHVCIEATRTRLTKSRLGRTRRTRRAKRKPNGGSGLRCFSTNGDSLASTVLRHSYASLLLANGADLATVSARLGHSSVRTP